MGVCVKQICKFRSTVRKGTLVDLLPQTAGAVSLDNLMCSIRCFLAFSLPPPESASVLNGVQYSLLIQFHSVVSVIHSQLQSVNLK